MILPAVKPAAAVFAALCILLWDAPVRAIESAEAALWAGDWNAGPAPPDDDQVQTVNTHDILTNDPVTPLGFSYVNAHNGAGNGPDARTRMEGKAVFESATRAVDREHGIVFTLQAGPEQGVKTITAATTADGKADPPVFSQRAGYRAGFDCATAATVLERRICRSRVLARADRELAEFYQTVRDRLAPPRQADVTAAQRAWLKERNERCAKGGKADDRCLGETYALRLAALRKLADPALGRAPRFDAEYVLGRSRGAAGLLSDTAFQSALFPRPLEAQLEKYQPPLTVAGDAKEARIGGQFAYDTILWPANARVTVAFLIVVQASGDVWIATRETSEPESQDYDGNVHVSPPRPKLPKSTWPASIRNW